MKLPATPRPYFDIFTSLPKERIQAVLYNSIKDKYLHWNDFRRRPPPAGLSAEEAWLSIKLARSPRLRAIPALLDKDGNPFRFAIPDELLAQLHHIDCGLGANWTLPDVVKTPSTRNEYLASTLMQEAITSSQLEGAVTTREVAKEMLRSGRQPRDKSERMIRNNYLTMQRIIAIRDEPLTTELIFQLHGQVTEGPLERPDAAGRFRREDENVRVEDDEGKIFHEPPKASELPERMKRMCAFANGDTPDFFIHPVIRAIILHFWLAYDHPFVDGNGRTARALFYWSMLHQKFQLFEFISISQILLKAPVQYAESFLHTETDDNDLTYFILHQSDVIERAAKALQEYVEHKRATLRDTEAVLRGIGAFNHRQQALLVRAVREPEHHYTIDGHRRSHGVVYQTARTDLFDLEKRGLLVSRKQGKTYLFFPAPKLAETLSHVASQPNAS